MRVTTSGHAHERGRSRQMWRGLVYTANATSLQTDLDVSCLAQGAYLVEVAIGTATRWPKLIQE